MSRHAHLAPWLWVLGPAAFALGLHVVPSQLRHELTQAALTAPQSYALAHWVHKNTAHLWLNIATWCAVGMLLGKTLRRYPLWPLGLIPVSIAMGASVSWIFPQRPSFVGLSALAIAWLCAGAMQGLALGPPAYTRWIDALVLTIVGIKCLLEAWQGAWLGPWAPFEPGEIAVWSHWIGAAWGFLWGAALRKGRTYLQRI